jgi:hypothetical protein
MARTKQSRTSATPGFAIGIKDDTELGLAMLIADLGDGHYQPIGVVVSSISFAKSSRDRLRRSTL